MGFENSGYAHLTLEDFRSLIAQIVREELAKLLGFQALPQVQSPDRKEKAVIQESAHAEKTASSKITQNWLTHAEAAVYLKTTSPVLYKLTSLRKIKFSKRGKRNYYKIEHLEQYLSDGCVQTQEEIIQQTQLKGKMKIIS